MIPPIKKVVIPVAGFGTRFLPATKAMPKSMFPILNKPVIQYIVEEAVDSGIEEVIFVTGPGKRAIEDHFDHNFELEHNLKEKGKTELLDEIQALEKMAKFIYVRQAEPLGDGHAILCAKDVIGSEPFAVLYGDDIIDGPKPALKQLLEVYEKTGSSVLCAEKVEGPDISKYGVVDPKSTEGQLTEIQGLVEKPAFEDAPSDLGVIGKYVCTPEVLTELAKTQSGTPDGEIRLIDGLKAVLKKGLAIHALQVEGSRFDTGNMEGLLLANMHFAKKDPELAAKLTEL